MSDQLRENGSAGIHPLLFRRRGVFVIGQFWRFSVQIVFEPNASYSLDGTGFIEIRKVLYRTAVTLNKYEHSTVDPYTNAPKLSYSGETPGTAIINKAGKVLREATAGIATYEHLAPFTTPPSDHEKNLLLNIGVLDEDYF